MCPIDDLDRNSVPITVSCVENVIKHDIIVWPLPRSPTHKWTHTHPHTETKCSLSKKTPLASLFYPISFVTITLAYSACLLTKGVRLIIGPDTYSLVFKNDIFMCNPLNYTYLQQMLKFCPYLCLIKTLHHVLWHSY